MNSEINRATGNKQVISIFYKRKSILHVYFDDARVISWSVLKDAPQSHVNSFCSSDILGQNPIFEISFNN